MPIEVTKYETIPALEYKFLHMQECYIALEPDAIGATCKIKATFIPHAYDANGNKVYKPDGRIVLEHNDYLRFAEGEYIKFKTDGSGDPAYMEAFLTMERALNNMLNLQKDKVVGSATQVINIG